MKTLIITVLLCAPTIVFLMALVWAAWLGLKDVDE